MIDYQLIEDITGLDHHSILQFFGLSNRTSGSLPEPTDRLVRLVLQNVYPDIPFIRQVPAFTMEVEDFAEMLGVDPKVVERWESGRQIQSKSMDTLMRHIFHEEPDDEPLASIVA